MRLKTTAQIVAMLSACVMTAHATGTFYPPGPGGTCPDTLIISQVQHGPTCRPPAVVNPDTSYVFGIKGIVIGVKNNGTSRTFYMQSRRSDLSYTGIDIFNGNGLNNPNVQIGDSVAVSGKVEEGFVKTGVAESGETEISGFDASNTTLDLPTNILSSGNSLPAFTTLTVADIRFPSNGFDNVTQPSLASGEPWESGLVKLKGPFVVAKRAFSGGGAEATYPGIETRAPNGGGFLCYKSGSPADSFYVDMTSFVTMTPPAVGTVVDSVRGVLQQGGRAGSAGINSWRLAVRSSAPTYANNTTDDLFLATPPEVSDAFPVTDDSVMVVFDRDVTSASVTIPGHYSLVVSERSVDYARMAGDNAVVCHIVGAYPDGSPDSVTAVGQTGLVNGLTNNTIKGKAFINGVLPISAIQAANPDSLPVCVDRSKYAGPGTTDGPKLSFRGVATGKFFGREYYVQDGAGGPRSGVKVFQPSTPLTVGHQYLIAGRTTEFFNETEITDVTFVQDEGPAAAPPFFTSTLASLDDFTCGSGLGEDYEGCLVKFSHLLLSKSDAQLAGPGGFFHASSAAAQPDTTTDIEVDCTATTFDPDTAEYVSAQGVLAYRFAQSVLFPRNNADISFIGLAGVNDGLPQRVSFSTYPNPARVADLRFALPKRERVDLSVYDIVGRKVATIASGVFQAGTYARSWNGRSDAGALQRPGMYLYRLRVGAETHTLRGIRLN